MPEPIILKRFGDLEVTLDLNTCTICCTNCGVAPRIKGGCLLCEPIRTRWAETLGRVNIRSLINPARDNPNGNAIALALADRLEETGWPEVAAWVRVNWPLENANASP